MCAAKSEAMPDILKKANPIPAPNAPIFAITTRCLPVGEPELRAPALPPCFCVAEKGFPRFSACRSEPPSLFRTFHLIKRSGGPGLPGWAFKSRDTKRSDWRGI